jgi:uncharacterized protein
MALFLLLTTAEAMVPRVRGGPSPLWYPLAYALKFALVALSAWLCRSTWRDFLPRPKGSALLLGAALGLAVAAFWVALDGRYPPLPMQARRGAFDPGMIPGAGRAAFLAVRLLGLVVLVPLIEELFWRSFLLRLIVANDFRAVPVGRVTAPAAVISAGLFALAHPEWLPALLTGLLWAWLLRRTRSLSACLVSHMTANLALGIYVLATGNWKFW